MKITDLLSKESIVLDGRASGKSDALKQMVSLMAKQGNLKDREAYQRGVFAREEEGTTGVGGGVAIPHAKSSAVTAPGLAAMVLRDGVEYEALDGKPVNLIFLIAAPEGKENVHLEVLSRLSVLLMDDSFRDRLREAETKEDFLEVIEEAEASDGEETEESEAGQSLIVAVTACPTGIAHTYMAAESIEKKARELGYRVKVETRGSGGAKNVLTPEEIRDAAGVIIAADTKVPMERFDGKRILTCPVSAGIHKAEELIRRSVSGELPVYHGENAEKEAGTEGSGGRRAYRCLMNGVSHMLPFVVGGGILIALAFLIDGFSVDLAVLSEAEREQFGTITPAAAFFKNLGGAAFQFMLPVLSGFMAEAIADRPGLAAGFVGGAIAAAGSSGFLGAIAAGFLAGFLTELLKKVFSRLPKGLEGLRPVLLYPLFGILLTGLAMYFIVEPPVGALNTMLNRGLAALRGSSAVLLGLLLGGMMAVDMGGPFNKAAYVFGTASIASGNEQIMAAVMVGGMVPPCAIALSCLLFPRKYTPQERKSGPTNLIMGLAFITEGAIPFAAADPFRVIPACVIGSGTAGALSMLFGCTLMAPHGGIFVFPVVGEALLYLLSLTAGTVVSAVLLGILKKDRR